MKQTMTTSEIAQGLQADFSWAASHALAEYLEEYEEATGEEMEFDRIAIRCDFSEYESAIEAAANYAEEFEDEDEAVKWLSDRTTVIHFEGGIVIEDF